jgi:hypothetical protein
MWALAVAAMVFMFIETGWVLGVLCLAAILVAIWPQIRRSRVR